MKKKILILALCIILPGLFIQAQAARDVSDAAALNQAANANLPLKRIALLSSGVGYFQHEGDIGGQTEITLPFDAASVNDALKSLVVNDPDSTSPSVRYAAQNTLERTLNSLKIDLSGTPGIAEILNGQKGAELELYAPNLIRGRIIGVEYRQSSGQQSMSGMYGYPVMPPITESWLSLFTIDGIRGIAIKDITSFSFIDEQINTDLNRALDLIMASRDSNARNLLVALNGTGSRSVSISYVIPTPVWKVSYRLDLSGREPFLQGWAIVDNDSDTDWRGVELSLVTGRPVSFIQNLYPPYRLSRPVVPLSIAGFAESRTYDSGYGAYDMAVPDTRAREMAMAEEVYSPMARVASPTAPAQSVAGGVVETAAGRAAGDQFEFTLRNPVNLERRQSAMLPLIEGSLIAEKTLIFSGSRASGGATINPAISVELTNTTGMKLPAGPITVYDGGTYAGDALIEFFPENEKRLISYGEDLSVTGNVTTSGTRYVTTVSVAGGVMTINRRQSYERVYTIRNALEETKKIIIEHPITSGAELIEPASAEDRTAALYRFTRNLAPKELFSLTVKEETPLSERITLAQLRPETFLSYSTNQEIPANVRSALIRAIELKKAADDATNLQALLNTQRSGLVSEQDRIRRNLEAAGNQSPQGQEYLRRLSALDSEIDNIIARINEALREADRARQEYENYLAELRI